MSRIFVYNNALIFRFTVGAATLIFWSFLLLSPNGSNGSCFTVLVFSNAVNGSLVKSP